MGKIYIIIAFKNYFFKKAISSGGWKMSAVNRCITHSTNSHSLLSAASHYWIIIYSQSLSSTVVLIWTLQNKLFQRRPIFPLRIVPISKHTEHIEIQTRQSWPVKKHGIHFTTFNPSIFILADGLSPSLSHTHTHSNRFIQSCVVVTLVCSSENHIPLILAVIWPFSSWLPDYLQRWQLGEYSSVPVVSFKNTTSAAASQLLISPD